MNLLCFCLWICDTADLSAYKVASDISFTMCVRECFGIVSLSLFYRTIIHA
jgi:hypothetical protein